MTTSTTGPASRGPGDSDRPERAGQAGRHPHADIERKWQARWEADGLYRAQDHVPGKNNWYALTMFPYPSGDVHIGHWYAYAPGDAHARFMRMDGWNVMHPQGFDAFGLPAENAAIARGIHPRKWTFSNVENMRRQFRIMGNSYDWQREIITCTPEYYRWNQYFFLQFLKAGLAYRKEGAANWCPSCQTTLANEQVKDGACERCSTPVTKRNLPQWFFRITKYAEELLDVAALQWPDKIKAMQRNWIGKSEGATVRFDISAHVKSPVAPVDGQPRHSERAAATRNLGRGDVVHSARPEPVEGRTAYIETFTTRIDTVFGVTFVVLAPEHPLVDALTQPSQRKAVDDYIERARKQSEIERTSTEREKTGVATGAYAVNPLNGERVPVLVGDYVLATYGTGAVMGVPAHDVRDFVFAKKYGLPIRVVVAPPAWDGRDLDAAYMGAGTQVNSGEFNGLPSAQGKVKIAEKAEANGWGARTTTYHLRDWLISRQRYWGTPIPVIYCDFCGPVPVPEKDLPVLLPDEAEFRPTGQSPLTLDPAFVNVKCPQCGKPAKRETDTMDTFMDSSWYHLRFTSAHEQSRPFSPDAAKAWAPVHQYMGGAEHAVMHLLYSRFFNKALRDLGYVSFSEPYTRLFNQGLLIKDHKKISKRANPLNPEPIVEYYGADALRLYLMFLGPWDEGGDWSDAGIRGVSRWLNRVWDLCAADVGAPLAAPAASSPLPPGEGVGEGRANHGRPAHPEPVEGRIGGASADRDLTRAAHATTRRVVTDMRDFKFNTSIAALMEFTNTLGTLSDKGVSKAVWDDTIDRLLLLLAPMAPHITEELWLKRGHAYSIHQQTLPKWDDAQTASDSITVVVQVNGKLRGQVQLPVGVTEAEAIAAALANSDVQRHTEGRELVRKIYIPGKLVNLVVR